MIDRTEQALSARAEQALKIERGAVPDFESIADPDGWPYPDTNGLVDDPATPSVWDDGRGPGTADALDAKAFEVAPDEVVCGTCFLVHRPGCCDR
ncbi:hypothetical protein SEA_FUNSIZED_82 [Mycobacterium phage Funsized]|nr:hypothetical protein SEA_FUNSIZED_82 [Mycobacterium phage Funsized]